MKPIKIMVVCGLLSYGAVASAQVTVRSPVQSLNSSLISGTQSKAAAVLPVNISCPSSLRVSMPTGAPSLPSGDAMPPLHNLFVSATDASAVACEYFIAARGASQVQSFDLRGTGSCTALSGNRAQCSPASVAPAGSSAEGIFSCAAETEIVFAPNNVTGWIVSPTSMGVRGNVSALRLPSSINPHNILCQYSSASGIQFTLRRTVSGKRCVKNGAGTGFTCQ